MEYNTGDPSETHTCAVCGTAHDLRQPCPHWALDERITTLEAELARLRPLAEVCVHLAFVLGQVNNWLNETGRPWPTEDDAIRAFRVSKDVRNAIRWYKDALEALEED